MNGPGVAFECEHKAGLHLWEDNFILEIINPATGEPLPEGQTGELVLTTLNREAMPILRYRTRDITSVIPEPCKCGRTHRRLARITGRSDDMLIIRGVNIFPQQIERVLMSFPQVGRNYVIIIEGLDDLTIKVELAAAASTARSSTWPPSTPTGREAQGRNLGQTQARPAPRRLPACGRRQSQTRH